MTDRYIRAMLRAATAAGYLTGWQGPHVPRRSYTIAPSVGDAHEASPKTRSATCSCSRPTSSSRCTADRSRPSFEKLLKLGG